MVVFGAERSKSVILNIRFCNKGGHGHQVVAQENQSQSSQSVNSLLQMDYLEVPNSKKQCELIW